jgi:sorbitol/mannitol transport system permease protein
VLGLTILLGIALALLLDQPVLGRSIVRLMVIAPFFVMPTVSALIWKNLLMHPVNGLFAWFARGLGFHPIDWFGQLPLFSIILIVSWEWLPFAFLILLTALQSLDEEQLEAARLDGAGALATFFHIQVPHMGRAIAVVVMMETIFLLGIFAEIYVTTAGGPGVATTNLTFLIYQRALLAFNIGSASAAGVIAIILANIMAAFLIRTIARRLDV